MAKETRCPYCLDDLVGVEKVVRCVSCRTPHHAICFDEHGGCVAFGCGGVGKADAGHSIMLVRPMIQLGARWRESPLLPLRDRIARYRPAKRIPEEQHAGPSGPWVRLSLEQEKLYPGQDLKARLVVAVKRDTSVRRLELRVFDEPLEADAPGVAEPRLLAARILGRPPLAMGSIMRSVLGLAAPAPRLRPGLHPWQVEIPRVFGWLVPNGERRLVQVGAVLERHGEQTVASPRVTLEIVPVPARVEPALARAGAGDPANAMIFRDGVDVLEDLRRQPFGIVAFGDLPERPAPAVRVRPSRRAPAIVPIEPPPLPADLDLGGIHRVDPNPSLAGAWAVATGVQPPPAAPSVANPADDFIAPPREDGTKRESDRTPPPDPSPPLTEAAAPVNPPVELPPIPPAEPVSEGWTIFPFRAVTTAGPRTGRVLRARFAERTDLPPLRLSLEVPPRSPEESRQALEVTIDAPHELDSLDLACRYELHDASGNEIVAGTFPMLEEVELVGEHGLPPGRTGKERLLVVMPVDPFLIDGARSHKGASELVLRLACEGFDPQGNKATSGTRVVRLPLAGAQASAPAL